MNNLLKIFLIINLFSSTTSAVNNSSLPLSESELKMGQNVSEIVKRDGSKLAGGTRVRGYSPDGHRLCERPCTLSFPAIIGKDKGFLTSSICAGSSVMLGDTIQVIGHVSGAYGYKPELGLEYAFVSVRDSYWSDETSRKIDYSHCVRSGRGIVDVDESLPILPTPSKPLSVGDKVYARGGVSNMVNGVILATGVTITIDRPGSCERETEQFHDVVKVKMDKDYARGNLGAPVYIPLPIPNSKKMIAIPVGQIVEDANWDRRSPKIWYYIPLDKILKDSGLKIESGDLSYLLPKPEEPNNEDLNNVPLTDNLTTSSNVSDSNLVKRQPNSQYFISNAGYQVSVSTSPTHLVPNNRNRKCTLGFAIKKDVNIIQQNIDHGFLTLGDCLYGRNRFSTHGIFNQYLSQHNPGELEVVRLGTTTGGNLNYVPSLGLNFAIVKILPDVAPNIYWNDRLSTRIPVSPVLGDPFADVIGQAFFPIESARICWWGGNSQHNCGVVVATSAPLTRPNPWNGLMDSFQNLIKVRADFIPRAVVNDEARDDQGAPVYFPIRDNTGRITRVQPIGILMDYVTEVENNGNVCQNVLYMYCVSLDKIFLNYPGLSLIGTPPHQ